MARHAGKPIALQGLLLVFPFVYVSAGGVASKVGVSTAVFLSIVYAVVILPYSWRLQTIRIDWQVSLGWILLVLTGVYMTGTDDLSRGGATTAFVLAGVLMTAMISNHENYFAAIKALAVGLVGFSVVMMVAIATIATTLDVVVQPRFGYLQGVINSDPNVIGFLLASVSLSILAGLVCPRYEFLKSRLERSIWWLVVAWLVSLLGMTQSRSALIGFSIGLSCIFLRRSLRSPLALAGFVVAVAGALLLAVAAAQYTDTKLEQKYSRIGEDTRLELWSTALRAWGNDYQTLLLGAGTGAAHRELGKYYPEAKTYDSEFAVYNPHSTVIEWILQFGLVGLIFSLAVLAQGLSYLFQGVLGRTYLPAAVSFAPVLMFFLTYGVSSMSYAPVVYFLWLSAARFAVLPQVFCISREERS